MADIVVAGDGGINALITPSTSVDFLVSGALTGAPGAPANLTIGSVTSGTTPAVSIAGTPPNQVLSFVFPSLQRLTISQNSPANPAINDIWIKVA